MDMDFENRPTHYCIDGEPSFEYAEEFYDAQGIYLTKGCEKCKKDKLKGYRPEILTGYDQSDVDEPIEPE